MSSDRDHRSRTVTRFRLWVAAVPVLSILLLAACAHTGSHQQNATVALEAMAAAPRPLGGADCDRLSGYDVLIVGAGLAGLAAGKELTHLGRSVLILEATDRVGGRGFVGHVSTGGPGDPKVPIDYGGAWIHGVSTNPLTSLVDRMGFQRIRSELDVPFYVDERRATPEEYERFNEAYEEYERALSAAAFQIEYEKAVADHTCEGVEEIETGSLAVEELCEWISHSVPEDEISDWLCNRARQVEQGRLEPDRFCAEAKQEIRETSDVAADYVPRDERFAEVLPLVVAGAGPLETAAELDASSAVDAARFAAGEDDLVDRGLGAFVEEYGEGLPICLSSPVTRVDYAEEGVVLEAGGRRYEATDALITVSVGVLRAGKIEFEPPLPEWKKKALGALRMGHMQKVILPFREDVFRDAPASSWVFVETAVEPAERELAARHGSDVQHDDRRVMAFVIKPLGANVAIGFYGGEWAELFEEQCAGLEHTSGLASESGCDDLAVDAAVRALSGVYGSEAVARAMVADQIHVTRWSLEPYTLGAYSVPVPGGWDQRQVLRRPVAAGEHEEGPLRLFFAGEACSRAIYNGSYPGAFETGIEAAREIHAELLAVE